MRWYDLIAGVYDNFSRYSYREPRKALIDKLQLQPGDSVFLIGCGTGLIFKLVKDKIGDKGVLVGLDASKNMLAQANKKARNAGYENVHLIHADARMVSPDLIKQYVGRPIIFDHVIGELSFSVMPDWQRIMELSLSLLKAGGNFGVLDGYRAKKDWINAVLNLLPRSDISRPLSDSLAALTKNYTSKRFGRTKILFIGVGQKK